MNLQQPLPPMFRNYVIIALRTLRRHKLYGFINIAGLAVGMASGLLILLFVWHEWSHDRFHENADRIYRLVTVTHQDDQTTHRASTPLPMISAIEELPEVTRVVRLSAGGSSVVRYGERQFREEGTGSADGAVFEVFDFGLLRGNPATALEDPYTVVLTQELAAKYFGDEDPLGKTLTINQDEHTVTGILAPVPTNSHVRFRLLTSWSTTFARFGPMASMMMSNWGMSSALYVLLEENAAPGDFEARLNDLLVTLRPENTAPRYELYPLPLTDLYLHAEQVTGIERRGDLRMLYVFSSIALLILLIGCINYMNLSTARSSMRMREVGVRKVTGAGRGQLVRQFLGESLLISFCALLVALLLVELVLPTFNALVERELAVDYLGGGRTLAVLVGLVLLVGLLAGSYPAFFLSSLRPAVVLKGQRAGTGGHALLRKGMVVTQFVLSIALITGASTVYAQLSFMRGSDPGFERDHVVSISITDRSLAPQYDALKQAMLQHGGVHSVTGSFTRLGRWLPEVRYRPEGASDDDQRQIRWAGVDHDFLDVFGLELLEGRGFSAEHPADATEAFILNESAVRALGWDDPVGRRIHTQLNDREGVVIGVVRDFHYASMRDPIEPMMLFIQNPGLYSTLSARVAPDQLSAALDHLRSTWHVFSPDWPFEYSFLDEELVGLYEQEERLARIIGFFSLLAILIACLGLFGLAAFTAETRTKEIGVRKVLGATAGSIVALLSKDFLALVVVAFVIAAPVANWGMTRWLEDFAYRVELGPGVFLATAALALGVALLTVSYHALRAASANPVDSLRSE